MIKRGALGILLLLGAACEPEGTETTEAGGWGASPATVLCQGDNDGIIQASEMAFVPGLQAVYLANDPAVPVAVDVAGRPQGDGTMLWDMGAPTDARKVIMRTTVPQEAWFRPHFPDATVVVPLGAGLVGLYRSTPEALELLGMASEAEGVSLMVYDAPVPLYRFPLKRGDCWTAEATANHALAQGMPFASQDRYRVEVVEEGTLLLPFWRMERTLKVRVELTQTPLAGPVTATVQIIFLHECAGMVAMVTGVAGDAVPLMARDVWRLDY